jgi:poly [ADP-ribose] polymerase
MEYCKYLILVDPNNNGVDSNKFYKMAGNGDDTFTVEFGRVGATPQTKTYPMSKWNSTLASKLKKGYVDRSDLMQEVIADSKIEDKSNGVDEFSLVQNLSVREIVKRLWDYANKTIQSAYSVRAEAVTQAMIDAAQEKIDYIAANYKNWSVEEFNKNLNELFIIVPRKMKRVSDCLVSDSSEYDKKLSEEQSLLDTMAGQVYKPKARIVDAGSEIKASESILQKMGITMEEATQEDIAKIKKAMGDSAGKFYKAWRVTNLETEERYQKFTSENNIGNVKLFCHGSRNQNWFNILKMGLKIRPAGVITTGLMFGKGAYFSNSEKYHGGVAKSIGYTSLGGYWTRDYQNCGFIAFFDVAIGDSVDAYSFDSKYYSYNLERLKKDNPKAWSLWAHGNTSMLRNDEIIVYDDRQMTIRYLVEIR